MEQDLMDKMLTWLDYQRSSSQPFFLYYAPNAIHRYERAAIHSSLAGTAGAAHGISLLHVVVVALQLAVVRPDQRAAFSRARQRLHTGVAAHNLN
jgi:hypothetical protein